MKKIPVLLIALLFFTGNAFAQDIIQENTLSISSDGTALFELALAYNSKELSDAAKGLVSLNKNFFEESLKKELSGKLNNIQISYVNLDNNALLSINIKGNAEKLLEKENDLISVNALKLSSKSQGYALKASQAIILPVNSEIISIEPKNYQESSSEGNKLLEWTVENGAELSISLSFKQAQEKTVLEQVLEGNALSDYGAILLVVIGIIIALIVLIKSIKSKPRQEKPVKEVKA